MNATSAAKLLSDSSSQTKDLGSELPESHLHNNDKSTNQFETPWQGVQKYVSQPAGKADSSEDLRIQQHTVKHTACETWVLSSERKQKIVAFEHSNIQTIRTCYRTILRVGWTQKMTNKALVSTIAPDQNLL